MNGKFTKCGKLTLTLTALLMLTGVSPLMAAKPAPTPKPAGTVVNMLDFDGVWSQEVSSLGWIPVVPSACQTDVHIAGANEVAIVNMGGFLAPSGLSNAGLWLSLATSSDGINFTRYSQYPESLTGIGHLAGYASTFRKIELVEGLPYVFGAEFVGSDSIVVAYARCNGTVTIVRR